MEASMGEELLRMSAPPNHSTITMTHVPRNSLMGWAEVWRITIWFIAVRKSLLILIKRCSILLSAMKALMMRKPPSVSSSCDMISPHCDCATTDWLLSFLLITPITQPARGSTTITNSVSCQLTLKRVMKHTTRVMGLRISMSIELVMEPSTAETSALMRAMMSPLRSSEKKLNGNLSTLA